MNANRLVLLAPLLALGFAAAAEARTVDVTALAERTGLTERQVRMVLGAPSGYAEYRTSYWIAEHRVMAALSDPDYYYEDGEPVVVTREVYTREPVVVEEHEYDGDEGALTEPLDEPLDEPASEQQLQVEDVDDD